MPGVGGRPIYADFADSTSVEQALVDAPREWLTDLVVWQYALLRAERTGAPRPSSRDLERLINWIIFSMPAIIAVRLVALSVGVLLFGVGGAFVMAKDGPTVQSVGMLVFAGLIVVATCVTTAHMFRGRGSAMRIVWKARRVRSPEDRLAMFERAIALEAPGQRAWWQ